VCLILFAFHSHPEYPLVVAANRDEFYDRPTAEASFWNDHPGVLAGRDLKEGGTWMGINRDGRFAAVTNYRDSRFARVNAQSRGTLVSSYLSGGTDAEAYLGELGETAAEYRGFSLIIGDHSTLFCYSNATGQKILVEPGFHGLSNHLLDSPWPKVEKGKRLLQRVLNHDRTPAPEDILDLLADKERPPDNLLPDTGVGLEWERILSPIFITSPVYGTCSSTALLLHKTGKVAFVERDYRPGPTEGREVRFEFTIEHPGFRKESFDE